MKVVVFDLGETLAHRGTLLPGAVETLTAVSGIRAEDGRQVGMGLLSDFDMPHSPAEVPQIRERYLAILDDLGIRRFFEPVDVGVTLSSEVGVSKPDPRTFRAALDKFGVGFESSMFVTENEAHVLAARKLGMRAVHCAPASAAPGAIAQLTDLVPIVRDFVSPSRPAPVGVASWRSREVLDAAATNWTRFGEDLFLVDPPAAAGATGRNGTTSRRGPEVSPGHLHLVVQHGRSFQQAQPHVPVLLDRGRFLVVLADPVEVPALRGNDMLYVIRPLTHRQVVFTSHPSRANRAAAVPWVQALVDGVHRPDFEADVRQLVSYPTRHSTSESYREAAMWVSTRLEDMGFEVRAQAIDVDGEPGSNVIADRLGAGTGSRGIVLVTAHLDSVNHDAHGVPDAPAPGADDNASGSAGVLQIARSLRDHPAVEDLRLILFGGEEQGLFGSRAYVDGLDPTDRSRIRAVVNMDMIGCLNSAPASVLLEGAEVSQAVIDGLRQAAATYTELTVETSLDPFASDHVPFIEAGLPAVLTIEGADQANENEHSERDRIETISFDLALEILRMNLAFVAGALGRVG